jgi:hypothetical protein
MHPSITRFVRQSIALALASALHFPAALPAAERDGDEDRERVMETAPAVDPPPSIAPGTPAELAAAAVVNFAELAEREALDQGLRPPVRPRLIEDGENEMDWEPGANRVGSPSPEALSTPPPFVPFVASPSPSVTFMGLDDIAMVDSSYIVIPPDVDGAVGSSKIMEAFNNNYRIRDKATGTTISTVGTATFWASVVAASERASLTDPRTIYDPYNNRWIVAMQTFTTGAGKILVGVSQTSDPSGAWYLYNFNSGATIDFPTVGFNKNWISVAINQYTGGGAFSKGINLIVNYPLARTGTGSGTIITTLAAGSHFCSAPCVTYSSTAESLFIVTHLSSTSATYTLDWISGTAGAPSYNVGGATKTRTGGGWVQPSGNLLPQSAPNAGASACGATPCPIETQDAQVRSAPTYRGGFIYYTQTVGLPSGAMTHTAAQWTKITTSGSPPTGNFIDGGRLEDPTATSTNGGKWYAYSSIAVNAAGDFMVGFSQFSSAQHPASGYAMHLAADGAGTIRDALIYKTGDDYYHKTFSTTTGRNRWGDYSKVQVDPCDDASLWALQEYAKTRTGTNDGNTGANSSRWSSWWANVGGPAPTVTILAGPSLNEGNAGLTAFNFMVQLSTCYSLPVTVNYQTADGSATVADNDYQAAASSIVIAPGSSSGTITVNVVGDANCENNETFGVDLTSATNGTIGSPSSATGTILTDDGAGNHTITASAGAGGSISPSGAVSVACGGSQAFAIAPDSCHTIADVLVDGSSVGAVTNYTFNNVNANHTIAASFALTSHTITASAGAGGSISPSGAVVVDCAGSQAFTITPDSCHTIADVLVDGSSVGAVTSHTFTNVQANHTITASFALTSYTITGSAGAGGSIAPSGAVAVDCAGSQLFTITPDACYGVADVLVDGSSVGAVTSHAFTDVQSNHTIAVSFALASYTLTTQVVGSGSVAANPNQTTFDCGSAVELTATPGSGFAFDHWTADASGSTNPLTVLMDADKTITAVFVDVAPPDVAVTSPNGGETWTVGESHDVTWSASDNVAVTSVDLDYSADDGATYPFPIASAIGNTGTFAWVVPNTPTTDARVRVTAHDAAANSAFDASDQKFTIQSPATAVPVVALAEGEALGIVPNPASIGGARVLCRLANAGLIRVAIFDVTGRAVRRLASGPFSAGVQTLRWDGRDDAGLPVGAGNYVVRFESDAGVVSKRLTMMR